MKNFMGGNKPDGGIDLQGTYKNIDVFVQCKKYMKNSNHKGKVGVGDLRNFYGGMVSESNGNISDKNIFMLFVTTGSYSFAAKEFAKKCNIKTLDYKDLAEKTINYNLDTFKAHYESLSKKGDFTKLLSKQFASMNNPIIGYTFDDLQEKDLFLYLKNIRSHIIDDILSVNEVETCKETFKDAILHQLAHRRITTYSGLSIFNKEFGNKINQLDKAHLVNYSGELIKGLQILQRPLDK